LQQLEKYYSVMLSLLASLSASGEAGRSILLN
jgi:hypothetical protein